MKGAVRKQEYFFVDLQEKSSILIPNLETSAFILFSLYLSQVKCTDNEDEHGIRCGDARQNRHVYNMHFILLYSIYFLEYKENGKMR